MSGFFSLLRGLAPIVVAGALAGTLAFADDSDLGCPNVGVKWINEHVAMSGPPLSCGGTLKFKLAAGPNEAAIEWNPGNCPSLIQIAPGHNGQTQRVGYKANNPQKVYWKEFWFYCSYTGICANSGSKPIDVYETHWSEEVCASGGEGGN